MEIQQASALIAIATQILNNQSFTINGNEFKIDILANWSLVPGNSIIITYYSGVSSGNPSGSTTNIQTMQYCNQNGSNIIVTKTFTYNSNNGILSITIS